MTDALAVRLDEDQVGVLYRFEDENYRFSFDQHWLRRADRPLLGQVFVDRQPDDIETSGLPCWFAHLLPQGPLRRLLLRAADLSEDDDFDLLAAWGDDLPGALVLKPTEHLLPRVGPAHRLPSAEAYGDAHRARFSLLAGAQYKLSMRPGERGLVIPVRGEAGTWIAKFQDTLHAELPRVEYATTCWARAAGILTPPSQLIGLEAFAALPQGLPVGEKQAFLIERFDRSGGARIHMEDFGQILDRPPGDRQYEGTVEEIAGILAYLAPQDLPAFVAQVVFCVLCGNGDAHLKNWSVIYPDRRNARLSPAYDLVATVVYYPRQELALSLAGTRSFDSIGADSFVDFASAIGRDHAEVMRWVGAAVEQTMDAWQQERSSLDYTDAQRARIEEHIVQVPLGRLPRRSSR